MAVVAGIDPINMLNLDKTPSITFNIYFNKTNHYGTD